MISHHLARVRKLLEAAATLPAAELERELRPGLVLVWFEGEEPSAALMAERLVYTLEVWVAAIQGESAPAAGGDLLRRFEGASLAFARLARRIRDRGAWDDAFVDALCEPPQSFTYGGVIAHVLSYGAVRREALAGVLAELGAPAPSSGDPIEWEQTRASESAASRAERPPAGQRSFCSFGTRPASVPFSCVGPPGATMPSTRIALSPSDRRSRPSVDDTSSSVSSFTRSRR
jgi:hypothetical protein